MSGAQFKFTLDDKDLRKGLREDLQRLENPDAFLRNVGEEMLTRIGDRFENEQDPDGQKWKPLAEATISARLKKFGNSQLTILRAHGHLAGSINYQVDESYPAHWNGYICGRLCRHSSVWRQSWPGPESSYPRPPISWLW